MSNEQFQNDKKYQGTMAIARNLLKQGIITKEEYEEIDTKYKAKYSPILGSILADIELISLGTNGNM